MASVVPCMADGDVQVERVFMCIGSAATDEALQVELKKYLSPVIAKLASSHEPLRKKVMELLIHVNRRVKDHENIQLPVEALLKQYQDPQATTFVTNFSIIYIKMGYPRLDMNKQVELIPSMLNCLDGKPQSHQDSLLLLMLPVFGAVKIPESVEKTASMFGLRERPAVAKLLLDFMLDLLLLPYGAIPLSQQQPAPVEEGNNSGMPVPGVPACMSIAGFKRVCGEKPLKSEQLEKLKVSVVKFLSSEVLPPSSVVLQLIVAAADTRFTVANAADHQMRKIESVVEWETPAVIAPLYVLYLGTLTPKDKTPADKFKNPSNTRIRLKIMPYLLKSKEATNYAPLALKVFFECLWGQSSNPKLKQHGVMFLHHVSFHADKEKLSPVGSVLFSGVMKVVEEEKTDAKLRSLAYGALAKLSIKLPNLLLNQPSQLNHLMTLMNALTQEEGDVLLAVQQALSMLAPVCRQLNRESQDQLCLLLNDHVLHPNAAMRRTAVHYAASVFPQNHVASRFILMLASGDIQDDIRLEARRQLYKPLGEDSDGSSRFQTPPFSSVISYVIQRVNERPKHKWVDVGTKPIPFSLTIMEQVLMYLEHCLQVECGGGGRADDDAGLLWPDSPKVGKLVTQIVEQHVSSREKGPNPMMKYIGFAELAAAAWSYRALEAILRVVAVAPQMLVPQYTEKLDWIKKFMLRGLQYGEVAAQLYGVVAGHISDMQMFEKAMYPIKNTKTMRMESQESCVLGVGFSYAYKLYAMKKADIVLEDWNTHHEMVNNFVGQLLEGNSGYESALIVALGEMARQAQLPLPIGDATEENADKKTTTLFNLVTCLVKIFNNKKLASKHREQAISTLGYLCVGHEDFPYRKKVLESLLALSKETNELEVHFAVGEALVDCALGTQSPSGRNFWTEEDITLDKPPDNDNMDQEMHEEEKEKENEEAMEKDNKKESTKSEEEDCIGEGEVASSSDDPCEQLDEKDVLKWLLDQLLKKYIHQTAPSVRQATCVWLLALLKRCRNKTVVQQRLSQFQAAFMNLLGDNNELVQDAASKGLGVVYDCCSQATRQDMVESLVNTLSDGKRGTITNVTSDTKIFQGGELGKAPAGGQLSTYRELCSLATDLNQPDLVYKFMNLANHNAIWNSKKGAAFGFSSLAAQAGTQLEPYLPSIVPKLYRYQHDPTPKIQQPMAAIWDALVKDTAKTVEKYYDPILSDLMTNLTHSQWRTRESCCHGLMDLMRRQPVTKAIDHIAEMWTTLFRVRDDIKESVRLACEKTLQTLSKSCIKVCETTSEESSAVLREVLPVLLTSGITSSVQEVRSVSVQTIMKLCRSGGSMVRPHLGTLIPALLEALSGLESSSLSYTSNRLNEDDRERLDAARVSVARGTPMMDTLNYVLQFIDENVLPKVVSGLIEVLKSSVGLSSRAAAAHVVETLSHTCSQQLEQYAGKLLSALVHGLNDRNPVIRKVYANAIGNLVKTAKSSSVEKLLSKLQSWYMEKEDDSIRLSAALTLRSMHDQSNDKMKQHSCQALPLAFLAMHASKTVDSDPSGSEVWEEIWSDNTPGMESGVRLYATEIIALSATALGSNNWALKAQAGRALAKMAQKLGSSMTEPVIISMVTLLTGGLSGRTWEGKDALVTALSDVAVHSKEHLKTLKHPETGDNLLDQVVTVLSREAAKEKMEYKIHAIKALTTVLDTYNIDKFEQVFDICIPYLTPDKDKEKDEDEEVERNKKEESLRWDLNDEMVHSLGRAWPSDQTTQEKFSERVVDMLNLSVSKVPRKTQLSIIGALKGFWKPHFLLKDLNEAIKNPLLDPLIHQTCRIFNYCLGIPKYYSLRRESLVVLNGFLERVVGSETLIARLREELLSMVEEARRDPQPDIQAFAATANKMLLMETTETH
ncbi:unnamed protein product, partial [Meganyctiphanes norvegica]